ncbi:mandelate racemase/muconate lactonizing enzyme family protein [Phytohabitans flavus]|uniref:2-oxo-3-deoxygalactonate 6-phosphate aldolase n=1 Tax=Phytohabitans flavus TaxID=1076124 RepID=A0A6F8XSQ2_9ACTN|nr:mandelate racemase/muconate lactonizing enzyme family protein [Phytohabitans flavus]BCB76778.1 2-oxo-3-deoxygalactonate 6-phosphate aldolase [Phytohabitans flavus]
MNVTSVEPIPVAYPEPNDFGATRYLCLVKVTTDEGAVGWGEAITQFPDANHAVARLVEGMAEAVVGRDPVHTEAIWRALKDRAWWYGYGGGLASYAIAALDIALWDLKGQALGRSVLDLLGGPVHERLPAIASAHAHHESIPEMVDETVGWLSTGLRGVKVGFGKRGNARLGYEHDRDVEYVRAMREAIGPDRALMIDLGIAIKWDVATAVRRVRAFEEHRIDWIEEPLGAWDPEGYATLRAKTQTSIAYGEKEWTLEGFERVLATGTCDVLGVDPARAEGITGFKKVVDRVEAYRRQANAHAWSSAITTAASLAISFSTPACKVFELKPLPNPMQNDLVSEPFGHVDGWVLPPVARPGLGITVDESVVDRYRA